MRRFLCATTVIIAVGALCGVAVARPASSAGDYTPRATSGTTTVCSRVGRHLFVERGRYAIRTPNWRGRGPVCIRNHGGDANFQVTRVPKAGSGGFVETFPSILYGCYWGVCTRNNKLPMRVRDVKALHSTLEVRTRSDAEADATFDLWFGHRPHSRGRGHINGAELMVFIKHIGGCCSLRDPEHVSAGRYDYKLMHWTAFDPRTKQHPYREWNYIQFRMTEQTTSVHRLDLLALIRIAEREHLIRPDWYLENVEAGFEVWHGGTRCPDGHARRRCGLAVRDFSVTVDGRPALGHRTG